MSRVLLILIISITCSTSVAGQKTISDTIPPDIFVIDTTIDYDLFFDDFESFMDSILNPRSYLMPAVQVGRNYFNFKGRTANEVETSARLIVNPMLTWYHKSGIGLNGVMYFADDGESLKNYQFSFTPSYDYLKDLSFATGFSYTRYFTKDSTRFYTSPLSNEVYAYFTYRKWWVRPTAAVSFGWGSRSEVEKRRELLRRLRLLGSTTTTTTESVYDLAVLLSARHDFYWLDVLGKKDHFRFTPQINFTAGTQKYGFNQTSSTYGTRILSGTPVLYNAEHVELNDEMKFQPLSLSLYLKTEYVTGKFFIQPQVMFDYYLPGTDRKLTTFFSANVGLVL